MKLKDLKYLLLLIFLISTSCEKDVKNDLLPGFEKKLVVTSFLSPADSVSFIRVTSNRPVYGVLGPYESPGIVSGWISDGEKEISMITTDSGLVFTKEMMPVVNNKSYEIRIVNDKGLSVFAECTVPERYDFQISVDTFSVVKVGKDPWDKDFTWREEFVSISVKDDPAKENYYHVTGEYEVHLPGRTYVYKEYIDFEKDVFTDREKNADGLITFSAPYNNSYRNSPGSTFIKIYLLNTEKSYYLYHKTIFDYKDDDNPFTEPTPVYSNIKGGLGIFTSYVIDSAILRLQ